MLYGSVTKPFHYRREFLEIGGADTSMDFSRITDMMAKTVIRNNILAKEGRIGTAIEKPVSETFKENPEVPPLE